MVSNYTLPVVVLGLLSSHYISPEVLSRTFNFGKLLFEYLLLSFLILDHVSRLKLSLLGANILFLVCYNVVLDW